MIAPLVKKGVAYQHGGAGCHRDVQGNRKHMKSSRMTTYILVASDRINWAAAGLIAAGSLIGGFVGAHYGRRLSPVALRACIVVLGLIALWRLLLV